MIDTLAHHPDLYPHYAALRRRGVHRIPDGRWVTATAEDVNAVLTASSAVVAFVADPAQPLAALQARMARFSDGDDHDRRRALAERLLAHVDPGDLRRRATALANARIAGHETVDVMADLARYVPVAVLAAALGAADSDAAVLATRRLALALAPSLGAPPSDGRNAPERLERLLAHTVPREAAERDDALANAIALLFQAMDATAGLIGNALVAAHVHPDTAASSVITEAVRHDPAVHLTTRVAAAPLHVGGRTIPAGDRVVVMLAAANRDKHRFAQPEHFVADRGGASFTFGAGARSCPGAAHAIALAAGVLDALPPATTHLATTEASYEPRANLRIPRALVVQRAG